MKRIATLSLVLIALAMAAPATHAKTDTLAPTTPAATALASDSGTTGTKSGDKSTSGTKHRGGKKKKTAKKAA